MGKKIVGQCLPYSYRERNGSNSLAPNANIKIFWSGNPLWYPFFTFVAKRVVSVLWSLNFSRSAILRSMLLYTISPKDQNFFFPSAPCLHMFYRPVRKEGYNIKILMQSMTCRCCRSCISLDKMLKTREPTTPMDGVQFFPLWALNALCSLIVEFAFVICTKLFYSNFNFCPHFFSLP